MARLLFVLTLLCELHAHAYDPYDLAGRWLVSDDSGKSSELYIRGDGYFERELTDQKGVRIRGDMEAGGGPRIKINVWANNKGKADFKTCQVEVVLICKPDGLCDFRTRQIHPPQKTTACNWNVRAQRIQSNREPPDPIYPRPRAGRN